MELSLSLGRRSCLLLTVCKRRRRVLKKVWPAGAIRKRKEDPDVLAASD